MSPQLAQQRLNNTRNQVHPHCIACNGSGGPASRLEFVVQPDGSVAAEFPGGHQYQGYCHMLHGGVIATLLDAAMTNCLFAHGHVGVTADLQIRYRHPVAAADPSQIHAWIERDTPPVFVIKADLRQSDKLLVTAVGKFMQRRALIAEDHTP